MLLAFTGDGKGKTTAALGNALRLLGSGKRAVMIQFIKGPWESGEHVSSLRLAPDFKIIKTGKGFVHILGDDRPFEEHQDAAMKGLEVAREEIKGGKYHLLILDEVHNAVALDLIPLSQLLIFLDYAKDKVEYVITTGRDVPKEIIERADLVTEVRNIKHPFDKGVMATKGLDF
ncbi:MAG: cob(I)yrinic acid a,c-diamide adenosyltransferase [Candidatus Pacebacteria bacterium]|jgi:cob(I)alamin adenosyltransferase|nr:cob(I)yrinic acid a,c-diamide adenosyltransferase [Candidatus Paceibacterota bacterium]